MLENDRLTLGEVLHLLSPETQRIIHNKDMKFTDVFLMDMIIKLNLKEQKEHIEAMDRELAKRLLMDQDDMEVPSADS